MKENEINEDDLVKKYYLETSLFNQILVKIKFLCFDFD
jgi:hypothetical protein